MTQKFISIIIITVITALLLVGCSSGTTQQSGQTAQQASTAVATKAPSTTAPAGTTSQKTFTAVELSKFDGQNGNPAYVAVDGIVYDVSNVRQWRNGQHNGYSAGKDLTTEFHSVSPHDASIFNGIPIVGKYVEK